MKTLVIHPQDSSTDFLKLIYSKIECTVIDNHVGKRILKEYIKQHDRVIMLGHGCEKGLFDSNYNTVVDSDLVYLLREKDCVAVWCNADVFFLKYKLKGIYTGMIISEWIEANMFSVMCEYNDLEQSNLLFAQVMRDFVNGDKNLEQVKLDYLDIDNNVIDFNRQRIYSTLHVN